MTILAIKNSDGVMVALLELPDNKCTPYCVAWAFDLKTSTWGQGHYFEHESDAMDYYILNYRG